jgi:hypothetical protein
MELVTGLADRFHDDAQIERESGQGDGERISAATRLGNAICPQLRNILTPSLLQQVSPSIKQ